MFIVYFSAPHRVDFRALVRDLGGRLRARVELRQIGPRDEARLQGGIGPCGRDLCCATFLKDFEPVSVRMAKDQDLPVNPLRIAGACGRLMCCLKYEHPLYQDFRKDAPPVGSAVTTPEGPGTVLGPQRAVGHGGGQAVRRRPGPACPKASVCGSRHAYEADARPARARSRLRTAPVGSTLFRGTARLPRPAYSCNAAPPERTIGGNPEPLRARSVP